MRKYSVVQYTKHLVFNENAPAPWHPNPEPYEDLYEALETVEEWGVTSKTGGPRKNNKVGIYVHEDDFLIEQDRCFDLIKTLGYAHQDYLRKLS